MEGSTKAFAAFGRLGPGATLGGHTILRSAGRGGMGVVWEAESPSGERVAIKTMFPALAMQGALDAMFVAEGDVASRLCHPNVCHVREVGVDCGIRFQVMEWMDGDSLATLLENGRLPVAVAARIALDVARGLDAAHAAGVVHRDVSPHNILLDRSGRAAIADFGVAKVAHAVATTAGVVKGKVRYMAPEQAYSEPVDARTDVYALGLVLYEASTGTSPFAAESDLAILTKIASPEPIAPPDVEPALRDIIVRATQKDAADRYASARDFAHALESVAAAPMDVAARLGRPSLVPAVRTPPSEDRRRGWPVAIAIAIAIGVGLVAVPRDHAAPKPVLIVAAPVPSPPPAAAIVASPSDPLPAPPLAPPKPPIKRAPSPTRAAPSASASASAVVTPSARDVLRTRD